MRLLLRLAKKSLAKQLFLLPFCLCSHSFFCFTSVWVFFLCLFLSIFAVGCRGLRLAPSCRLWLGLWLNLRRLLFPMWAYRACTLQHLLSLRLHLWRCTTILA